MNYKGKVLIKNILNIILFTINIVGIIISCELFSFFYRLKKSGKAEEIGKFLEDGMETKGFKNTYKTTIILFIICSAVVTTIFLYFLYKLFQSMSESRNIDIGIRYVLGYRKEKVLLTELGYGMSAVIMAEALAVPLSLCAFNFIKKIKSVAAMIRSAEMNFFKWDVCIVCLIVVAVLLTVNIAVRVQIKYGYTKNNSVD